MAEAVGDNPFQPDLAGGIASRTWTAVGSPATTAVPPRATVAARFAFHARPSRPGIYCRNCHSRFEVS